MPALTLSDTATGRQLQHLADTENLRTAALEFTPDGTTLAATTDQRILLWRTDTGQLTNTICLADSYRADIRYVSCR